MLKKLFLPLVITLTLVKEISSPPHSSWLIAHEDSISKCKCQGFGNITDFDSSCERFDLTDGRILFIREGDIKTNDAIKMLSLQNNGIRGIEKNSFKNLPNLKLLDLSRNNLHCLPENLFGQNENLSITVDLTDNPVLLSRLNLKDGDRFVKKYKEIKLLEVLICGAGDIALEETQTVSILNTTKHRNEPTKRPNIDREAQKCWYRDRTEVPHFDSSCLLLDLRDNNITDVQYEKFIGKTKLRNLDLSHNPIEIIGGHTFQDCHSLLFVDLSDTLIQCLPKNLMGKNGHKDVFLKLLGNENLLSMLNLTNSSAGVIKYSDITVFCYTTMTTLPTTELPKEKISTDSTALYETTSNSPDENNFGSVSYVFLYIVLGVLGILMILVIGLVILYRFCKRKNRNLNGRTYNSVQMVETPPAVPDSKR